jgi:hypothetical protein
MSNGEVFSKPIKENEAIIEISNNPFKIRHFLNEKGVLTPYAFRIKVHILIFNQQTKTKKISMST